MAAARGREAAEFVSGGFMRFIHMADVHLGARPDSDKSWGKAREQEIWDTFRGVIETAGRERMDLLLISGDLFHRQPLVRELREVNALFASVPEVRVVLIAGNHDYVREDSAYLKFSWSKNVTGLWEGRGQKVFFPELQTYVYGVSYRKREIDMPAYQGLKAGREPGIHILMEHGDGAHLPLGEEKLEQMGFSYVALGHIHKPGTVGKRAVYPGSLEPVDKNETGSHGYVKGEFVRGRLSLSFVPAAKRSYLPLEIAVDPRMTAYEVNRQVKAETERLGKRNLFKLTLKGLRNPGLGFSEEMFSEICHLADFRDMTRPDYNLEELKLQYRGTLLEIIWILLERQKAEQNRSPFLKEFRR